MLHNNAAKQRHSEKPASAPKASQTIPRAQGRANILISTLKQRSQHEDTETASLTDGNMDTHIIHIQDAHSPPLQLDLMTSAQQQTHQQSHGPAGMLGQNSELSPRLHDTIPLGKDTGKPAWSSDLSRGQSKECYPGMRHRDYNKHQYQISTKKRRTTLNLQQLLNTHTAYR